MANVMKNREKGKKGWLRRLVERRVRMWALKKMGPNKSRIVAGILASLPIKEWPLTISIIRSLKKSIVFCSPNLAEREVEMLREWIRSGETQQREILPVQSSKSLRMSSGNPCTFSCSPVVSDTTETVHKQS